MKDELPSWYSAANDDPFLATVDFTDLGYGKVVIRDAPKTAWNEVFKAEDNSLKKLTIQVCRFTVDTSDTPPDKWPSPMPPSGTGSYKDWEAWVRSTPNKVYSRIERAVFILGGYGDPLASLVTEGDGSG